MPIEWRTLIKPFALSFDWRRPLPVETAKRCFGAVARHDVFIKVLLTVFSPKDYRDIGIECASRELWIPRLSIDKQQPFITLVFEPRQTRRRVTLWPIGRLTAREKLDDPPRRRLRWTLCNRSLFGRARSTGEREK